ncbi:MAG: hypothetical protein PUE13_06690 [Clostridiales bacterium]|nr:hypothetical protein [Clostridiales bacterium]
MQFDFTAFSAMRKKIKAGNRFAARVLYVCTALNKNRRFFRFLLILRNAEKDASKIPFCSEGAVRFHRTEQKSVRCAAYFFDFTTFSVTRKKMQADYRFAVKVLYAFTVLNKNRRVQRIFFRFLLILRNAEKMQADCRFAARVLYVCTAPSEKR